MELLSDEEVGRVLSALDSRALLGLPQASRGLRAAVLASEEEVWQSLLQAHSQAEWPPPGSPEPPPPLRGKDRYRLQRYLHRRQLPSLPDALRCAADHDHRALLRLLLHARADPNAAADSGAWGVGFTQVGAFALHVAAKRGHLAVLDVLLEAGADVDAADQNGRTGLAVASASGQDTAARHLLEKRAAVDAASDYGYSALHYASLLPRPELVELLLDARASPAATDKQGQTALHVALNALPRRAEQRLESSCDPSGYGDEYCYCRDTSHGYGGGEGDRERERSVLRAARALLRHGASAVARDDQGRAAADILEAKRRPDLRDVLEEVHRSGAAAGDVRTPLAGVARGLCLPWCPAPCLSALRAGFGTAARRSTA